MKAMMTTVCSHDCQHVGHLEGRCNALACACEMEALVTPTRSRKVERRIRTTIDMYVMPFELTATVQAIQAHFNAGGTTYTIPYTRTRVGAFDIEVTRIGGTYYTKNVARREGVSK